MADEHPFRVNRSALPLSVRTLFNPENCFARGGLTMEKGKPVLTGNCQVVQFGRNRTGNNCMFVCQADFPDNSYRPVLASFVFDHQGRAIEFYFGNSSETPSWETEVLDGTRASFGFMAPPPPPSQQYQQQPQSHAMFGFRMRDISEQLKRAKTQDEMDALGEQRTKLKQEHEAELAAAAEAAKAAAEAAKAARDAYDELVKTPRWGCTSVLKGPLKFVGCQRRDSRDYSVSHVVDGFPYVSCVGAHAEFDREFDTSPEELPNITPHFKYDPVTGNSMYGASGREYYDTTTLGGNVHGNKGFQSFVILTPSGNIREMETRQGGECTNPTSIPERLRASFPETNKKFKLMLVKGNASLRSEMTAFKWLAENPLAFPTETKAIDSPFVVDAFRWLHELSTKFEKPSRLTLSSSAMAEMLASRIHASPAAMHSPAMRAELFKGLTEQPIGPKPILNSCKCTPTHPNPRCPNQFCPFRHARLESLSFEWPLLRVASGDPAARLALESEMSAAAAAVSAAATAKQRAAEAAEEKRRAADAAREAKTERAKEARLQRQLAAASAKASAEPTGRARRPSAAALASSASAAASAAAPAVASSASRKRKTSEAPASAAPPAPASASSSTKRKARGGAKSKSKSKSKRRLRK